MEVLHLITGLKRGGAENALYRLIAADVDPSRFHVVGMLDEGVYAAKLRLLGARVTTLEMHSPIEATRALLSLIRILRESRPRVVQTWMYHADLLGSIAAKIVGIPVCWGVRQSDLMSTFSKSSTRAVARACAWISGSVPSAIVACAFRAKVVHREFGYADKFIVIPNGVNIEELRPDPAAGKAMRRQLGIPSDANVIGHIGRADSIKNHDVLLHAFEKVVDINPKAILLLIGTGLTFDNVYLSSLLPRRDLRDRILALGPREDVSTLMNAMDVFVLSSASEGFPNVIVEAMACGVPCVVTDVGDAASMVADTGWVRPIGDAAGLANDVLAAFAESPDAHADRARRARERVVTHYSVERMVSAYNALWQRVGS